MPASILLTRKLPSVVLSKVEAIAAVEMCAVNGGIDAAQLRARIANKDAVICMLTEQIDKSVIDAGTRLKVIANVAVGYNNIDVAYAKSRGIIVTNTPDVLTDAVADLTWALILG